MSLTSSNLYSSSDMVCPFTDFWGSDVSHQEKCLIMTTNKCDLMENLVDFFKFYFCSLNEHFWLMLPLIILFYYLLFRFIYKVKRDYLIHSTSFLCEWGHLSEIFAGCTILAFANGSGEIYTVIASNNTYYTISYSLGLLLGSGLIIFSLVNPLITRRALEDLKYTSSSIVRDTVFYFIFVLYLIFVGIYGRFSTASIVIFFIILILWFIVILIQYVQSKHELRTISGEESVNQSQNIDQESEEEVKPTSPNYLLRYGAHSTFTKLKYSTPLLNLAPGLLSIKMNTLSCCEHDSETIKSFNAMKFSEKICVIIEYPFNLLRRVTIPPVKEMTFNKLDLMIWPIPGLLFMGWCVFGTPSWEWFYVLAPLSAILTVIIFLTCPENEPPAYFIIIQIIGFVASLMWIYVSSIILVDLTQFCLVFTNLNSTFLGFSLLGIGHNIPTAILGIKLAKEGYPLLSISWNIFSQIFNVLIAFGWILGKSVYNGEMILNLYYGGWHSYLINLLLVITLLVVLSIIIVVAFFKQYNLGNGSSNILIGLFLCFIMTWTILSIYLAA